jgi:hypothetical protein
MEGHLARSWPPDVALEDWDDDDDDDDDDEEEDACEGGKGCCDDCVCVEGENSSTAS